MSYTLLITTPTPTPPRCSGFSTQDETRRDRRQAGNAEAASRLREPQALSFHSGSSALDARYLDTRCLATLAQSRPLRSPRTRLACSQTSASIELEALKDGIDLRETLSRARFEELNMDLFKKTMAPVEQVGPLVELGMGGPQQGMECDAP